MPTDEDLEHAFREGIELTPEEAMRLEERVGASTGDVDARFRLLGYYIGCWLPNSRTSSERRREHVFWIIANHPGERIARFASRCLSTPLDELLEWKALELWQEQVARLPTDVGVLLNAADFAFSLDRELHRELRERARSLDGSKSYREQIDELEVRDLSSRTGWAEDALMRLSRLEEIVRSNVSQRPDAIEAMARLAFELGVGNKARQYAEELLSTVAASDAWNAGDAHFRAHTVLGLLALRQNDLEFAKAHLTLSARMKGSPSLDSFGPNMLLAQKLLEVGERDVVLEFFRLCARWWKMGEGQLERWADDVRHGRMPDFGANLKY